MSANLFEAIERKITCKDAPFLETTGGDKYSYDDMLALSAKYANALVSLGVKPGDRVVVQVNKSPEALFLYLAGLRAGAVYLPLNTDYTMDEVAYFLGDSEPVLVICRPQKKDEFNGLAARLGVKRVQTLDGAGLAAIAEKSEASFKTVPRKADDLAAILYTSGTTGRSKGAMLTHKNLTSNARVLRDYWQFTSDDILLHGLPIYHTHGLFVATNTVLLSGSSLLFMTKFNAAALCELLPRATVMMGVPTHYHRLLGLKEFKADMVRNMRLFISGSAPLSSETHKEFSARAGHAILERYGMTETNMNTSNPYDGPRRAGTVGLPLPGVELRIADLKTGRLLPQGEIGVIEVRGPNVFKGYWRMPEKTAAEFRPDGFFITGDLGYIDDLGYIHISGRDKDLIITGGLNVYPAEIEAAIDALPQVSESAVIGLPHADYGEGVTAIVALYPGKVIDERTIKDVLAKKLAAFKVPKRIITVDALPRNAMGKIQKKMLRKDYQNLFNKA
ncbi:Long-chain-fatty-acid--CoA ligase [hydrothermal vent metagenome]|uniref:Long-chain-fatty-acid--CoA ligase n=1 Tax=hydrothermal vent metagenome TaxID=652676 RepID=A0A3B1AMG3_9ZZZZ